MPTLGRIAAAMLSAALTLTVWAAPTSAQEAASTALQRELEEVRRATAVYQDPDQAKRAGYVRFRVGMDAPLMGEHWVHPDLLRQPVDLRRPAVLQYTRVGDSRVLVGLAYGQWQRPGEPPPEGFAGNQDQWHVHDMPELVEQLTRHAPWLVRWVAGRGVEARGMNGPDGRPLLAMVHLWLWSENPDGLFANYNPALPYLRAGLPTGWARPGGHAAARGIELLRPDACKREVARTRVVAADATQRRTVAQACEAAVERVTAAQAQGAEAHALNQAAARAWLEFSQLSLATLTPEQRQELAGLRGGSHAQ